MTTTLTCVPESHPQSAPYNGKPKPPVKLLRLDRYNVVLFDARDLSKPPKVEYHADDASDAACWVEAWLFDSCEMIPAIVDPQSAAAMIERF